MNLNLFSPAEWRLFAVSLLPAADAALESALPRRWYKDAAPGRLAGWLHANTPLFTVLHALFLGMLGLYVARLWRSRNPTVVKLGVTAAVLQAVKLQLISLLEVWNACLGALVTNPPLRLDKRRYFPGHAAFEARFEGVRDEVLRIVDGSQLPCFGDLLQRVAHLDPARGDGTCWRWGYLKTRGVLDEGALAGSPLLRRLLADPQIANASVSMVDPRVSIPPHRGYFKGYLRYHLCVETPDDDPDRPYIVVGGQKHTWQTGEGVMLDDMFEHEVVNRSDRRRIVLFLDIRRRVGGLAGAITDALTEWAHDSPLVKAVVRSQHAQKRQE